MQIRSVRSIHNLKGKRVLVRVDFNVPLRGKKILDDSRLRASLPTIEFLRKKGAKVILVTHLGRPEGKKVAALKLEPVAKRLGELLNGTIVHPLDWNIAKIQTEIKNAKAKDIVLLQNVRFHSGEEKNDAEFARVLASLADVFVLDGFAVAHRAAASVSGIAEFLPSYAGLLLEKEMNGLDLVLQKPRAPFLAILGGAKMETKVPIMKNLLPKVDMLLFGGGIVNTYLKAAGYGVGDSLFDKEWKQEALSFGKKKKVVKPLDVVVGTSDGRRSRVVLIQKKPHLICKKGEAILDVGPRSIQLYAKYIQSAKTLVWNGAFGYFEQKPYDTGTFSLARLIATRSKGRAFGVIGGGETVQAMDMVHMSEYVDLVSTGGGAMLEYLSGKKLPGIEALRRK